MKKTGYFIVTTAISASKLTALIFQSGWIIISTNSRFCDDDSKYRRSCLPATIYALAAVWVGAKLPFGQKQCAATRKTRMIMNRGFWLHRICSVDFKFKSQDFWFDLECLMDDWKLKLFHFTFYYYQKILYMTLNISNHFKLNYRASRYSIHHL